MTFKRNVLLLLAVAATSMASTTMPAHSDLSWGWAGRCEEYSSWQVPGKADVSVTCNGAMVLVRSEGLYMTFLTLGSVGVMPWTFTSGGFLPASPAGGRTLPVAGVIALDRGPNAPVEVEPAQGQCAFSHEPFEQSTWITCRAETERTGKILVVRFEGEPVARVTPQATASPPQEKSYLFHNGSEIVATFEGQRMRMYYEKPKPSLRSVDVDQGTLLFDGTANDGHIRGTAFAFRKGCPPAPYQVEGVAHGDVGFELAGPGPVFGPGCSVTGFSWNSPHSRLIFAADNRRNQ